MRGIVRPGDQPFDFNALTLAHSWLVAMPLTLYMLAAVVFVPLAVVFGVVLLPSIFLMTFLLMYVPMQLGAGRLVYCLCGCLLVPRCCRRTKRRQHAGADDAAKEQAELMVLKALSTILFAFVALSTYFTPFLVGRKWGALVAEMYALPEIDLTKALSVLGNLELALAWPEMEWHIEMPTLLSVGVLFLELTTRVVGCSTRRTCPV